VLKNTIAGLSNWHDWRGDNSHSQFLASQLSTDNNNNTHAVRCVTRGRGWTPVMSRHWFVRVRWDEISRRLIGYDLALWYSYMERELIYFSRNYGPIPRFRITGKCREKKSYIVIPCQLVTQFRYKRSKSKLGRISDIKDNLRFLSYRIQPRLLTSK